MSPDPIETRAEEAPVDDQLQCAAPHPADEAPALHVGQLCARHWHLLLDRLRELEVLFALLPETLESGPGAGGRTPTRVGSPAPGRLSAMAATDRRGERWRALVQTEDDDLVVDVEGALDSWLRLVDEEHPRKLLPFSTQDWAVDSRGVAAPASDCVRWRIRWPYALATLRREVRWLAASEHAAALLEDLARFHRELDRATGAGMWPPALGPCPNCGRKLYPDPRGADLVQCGRCKATWEGVAYARLRLILGAR